MFFSLFLPFLILFFLFFSFFSCLAILDGTFDKDIVASGQGKKRKERKLKKRQKIEKQHEILTKINQF